MGSLFQPEKLLGVCKSRSGQVHMSTYKWRGFVLVQETHWTEPLPASGCHTPGEGLGKGMGSGRVWPRVQLQPGKEMVKQGCGGEPCVWRVDRDRGCCFYQAKNWGASNETCGDKLEDEALGGVPRTPCCRMLQGLNASTASREAPADSERGCILRAASGSTRSAGIADGLGKLEQYHRCLSYILEIEFWLLLET